MHKQWTFRHIGIHPRVPPTGFRSVNETLPDDLLRSTTTANQPRARQSSRSPSRSPVKKSHLATLYASDKLILNGLADDCLHELSASTASKPGGRAGAGKPGSPPFGIAPLPTAGTGTGGRRASRSAMALGANASRAASVTFEKQRASVGDDAGVVSLIVPASGGTTVAAAVAGALPKIGSNVFAGGRCGTVRELDSVGNGGRGSTTSRAVSRAEGLDATTDLDYDSGGGGFVRGNVPRGVELEESFAKKYKDMVKPKELVSEEASALESVEKSKMFVHSVAEDFEGYLNTVPSIDPMLEVDERLRKMSMETSSQQQQQQQQQQQLNLDASQQLTPREATPLQLIITDGATGLGASSQALSTFATNDLLSCDSVADKPGSPPSGTGAATAGESSFVQTVMTQLYPTLSKQTSFLTSLVLQVQPELHAPAELLHYIEHDLGFPLDLYCPATWPNMFTLPSHMVAATVGIPKHNAPNASLNPHAKSSSSSTIKVVKQPRRPSFIYRRSISMGPSSSTSASSTTRRGSQRAGSIAVGNRSRKASRANSILIRSRRGTATSAASHSGDKSHSNPPSQPGSRPGSQPNSRPGSGGGNGSEAASRHSQSRASSSRVVSATASAILAKLAAATAEANSSAHGHASLTEKSGYASPLSAAPMVPTVVVADGGSEHHGSKDSPGRHHHHVRSSAATAVSIVSPDSMPTPLSTTAAVRRTSGSTGRMHHAAVKRIFPQVHYPPIRVKVQKRKARRVDDLYTRELDIIAPTDPSTSPAPASKSKPKREPSTIHPPAPWYRPPHHWYSGNHPAPSDAIHASLSDPAPTANDKRTAVSQRLAQLTERSRAEFLALESKYRLEESGFNDSNGFSANAGFGGAGGSGAPSARKSVSAASTAAGIDRRKSAAVAGAGYSRSGSIAVAVNHGHASGSAASSGGGGGGAFE